MKRKKLSSFLNSKRNIAILWITTVVLVGAIIGCIYYYGNSYNESSHKDKEIEVVEKVSDDKVFVVLDSNRLRLLDSENSEIVSSEDYDKLYATISDFFSKNYSFYLKDEGSEDIRLSVEKNSDNNFIFTNEVDTVAVVSEDIYIKGSSDEVASNINNNKENSEDVATNSTEEPTQNTSGNLDKVEGNSGNQNRPTGGSGNKPVQTPSKPTTSSKPNPPTQKPDKPQPPAPDKPSKPIEPNERTWWYRDDLSKETFRLINEYRVTENIKPFIYNSNCQQIANKRAELNAKNMSDGHDNLQMSIYTNMGSTAKHFVNAWKASPIHRGGLKNDSLTQGAVSVYEDSRGYFYVIAAFDW